MRCPACGYEDTEGNWPCLCAGECQWWGDCPACGHQPDLPTHYGEPVSEETAARLVALEQRPGALHYG